MTVKAEDYPCTDPVEWVVEVGRKGDDSVTALSSCYPKSDEAWTQSSNDCLMALFADSAWINLNASATEKWEWVRDNAPEWLTVEIIDVSSS